MGYCSNSSFKQSDHLPAPVGRCEHEVVQRLRSPVCKRQSVPLRRPGRDKPVVPSECDPRSGATIEIHDPQIRIPCLYSRRGHSYREATALWGDARILVILRLKVE